MQTCTVALSFTFVHLFTFNSSHSHLQPDVTGPSSATSGILFVYDIFGFSPQAKQGADLLAYTDPSHEYQVYMPDLLRGDYATGDLFPADTEEKQRKLAALFEGPANIPKTAEILPAKLKEIAEQAPGIKKWGAVGFCWGGKVRLNITMKVVWILQAKSVCGRYHRL